MRTPARPRRLVVVRYHLPDGTRCTRDTPGAVRTSETTDTYYATLKVDGRRRTVSLKTADEGAAWAELRRLQRREHERAAGITDDRLEQAARPLEDHLKDWEAALGDKGGSAEHVRLLLFRVRALAGLAGWGRVTDLSEDSCLKALAELQRGGSSAQTRNHYAAAARQFARWCCRKAKPRRLADDPLSGVGMISVEGDRRHERRCPADEEVARLFAWLAGDGAKARQGMDGATRALGYKLAMATGFRSKEMRSLSRESFDLDAGTVAVRAAYSKNKRRDVHHLPAWLVAELRAHFAAGGRCWAVRQAKGLGRVLGRDLDGAGVARRVEGEHGPLYFDYHALRHWYVTQIASQPGISPKAMMALCRHSNPALTLKVYARVKEKDLRAAAESLPVPGAVKKNRRKG